MATHTFKKDNAPHWIDALSDSLIKVAAAISIVIASLAIYFKPDPVEQAIGYSAKMMETFKVILDEKGDSNKDLEKIIIDMSMRLEHMEEIDHRLEHVESLAHAPAKRHK